MLIVEIGSVGDWDRYLSRAYSAADGETNCTKENATGRGAAVMGVTGLPGNSVRVWRVPLSRAEAQFQVLQRIASKLETWGLLTTEPVDFPEAERADGGGASFLADCTEDDSKVVSYSSERTSDEASHNERGNKDHGVSKPVGSKSNSRENVVDLKVGDSVFFRTDDRRWVAAVINGLKEPPNKRGSRTYSVTETLTGNSVPKVGEKRLRRLKHGTKLDPGEGVYHWDGMTDSEDEEWEPISGDRKTSSEAEPSTSARQSDGKNGSKSKTRLHFGHFEQLALLFANCGGTEEAVERCLTEFRTQELDGQNNEVNGLSVRVQTPSRDTWPRFRNVRQLVRAILSRCKLTPKDTTDVETTLNVVHSPVGTLIPVDEVRDFKDCRF